MRIIVHATSFYPLIGGLEEVARLCSQEFLRAGHDVLVVTDTPLGDSAETTVPVCRRPTPWQMLRLVAACDIFLQFNLSLKGLIFPWLCRKPVVVSHQSWFWDIRQKATWRGRLKLAVSRVVKNIACSQAVGAYLGCQAEIIPNPYDNTIFRIMPEVKRERDVLFVGRLVSDKGANLLVESVARLAMTGLRPSLTIVGCGPEAEALREQVKRQGLADQTIFTGPMRGAELAREMNRHRILVVPSMWPEPFGIVALEGGACGCWVIGSEQGGLKEAIGAHGQTFPNGDVEALTKMLAENLAAKRLDSRQAVDFAIFTAKLVAKQYLGVLGDAVKAWPPRVRRQVHKTEHQ